jgi:hypothetical protein
LQGFGVRIFFDCGSDRSAVRQAMNSISFHERFCSRRFLERIAECIATSELWLRFVASGAMGQCAAGEFHAWLRGRSWSFADSIVSSKSSLQHSIGPIETTGGGITVTGRSGSQRPVNIVRYLFATDL